MHLSRAECYVSHCVYMKWWRVSLLLHHGCCTPDIPLYEHFGRMKFAFAMALALRAYRKKLCKVSTVTKEVIVVNCDYCTTSHKTLLPEPA